ADRSARPGSSRATSGADCGEQRSEMIEAARHGRRIALRLDARPDDLELERPAVPCAEELAEDPAERDVAVAGYRSIGRRERADDEVVELHDAKLRGAARDRVAEAALAPDVVHLHADAKADPRRQIDRVAQAVQEAEVEAKPVGVLDGDRDAARCGVG